MQVEYHVNHVAGICSIDCEPTPDWVREARRVTGVTDVSRETCGFRQKSSILVKPS